MSNLVRKGWITGLASLALAATASAAPVTGWEPMNGNAGFSGGSAATDSPVTTDADGDVIAANFTAITLAEVGHSVTLAGSVTINGALDAGQQFRWGLFDGPDVTAVTVDNATGFVGFWAAIGNSPTSNGLSQAAGTTTNPFGSGAATLISDAARTGPAGTIPTNTPIDFALTIERISETQVSLVASANAANGTSFTWAPVTAVANPASFTYDAAGFLLGSEVDGTQAAFSNLQVSFIPEPASLVMMGLGSMLIGWRRRF